MAIHPQAIVDPSAEVDETAIIGPFCVVGANVRLGPGCELRNHATVYGRASIGAGTIVFPGAVVGSDPQDLKYKGEDSEVIIGDNCRIHECVTISKGTAGGGMQTVIGDNCLIMAYAHIAHDCRLAEHVVVGNNAQLAGHVVVGRKVVISGLTGVHHFVTIGELAFIAAMSGLRQDAPPYIMMDGVPAEPRGVNMVGLRRDGWSEEDVQAAKEAFRRLYKNRNGSTVAKIVEEIEASPEGNSKPVVRLCTWMRDKLDHGIKGRVLESTRH